MPGAREAILHQIEYRWQHAKDLSPVASTMSQESRRGWDAWIRDWVRHPHGTSLSESVCYQIQPSGRAALAWRYRDSRAAEQADGSRGRPLVSRVLVGQAALLTPDIAIAMSRTGPSPALFGPPPGTVTGDTQLPLVSIDDLRALAAERAAAFDAEAAGQGGLQAVLAAALSEPQTPLAVHIRDTLITRHPSQGVQGPLLWGLWRIAGPLFGSRGPHWSFSSFELPLGDLDPAILPHIVFRQAQDGSAGAPTRTRKEVRVRPLAPDALDPGRPYGDSLELAGWLVDEYAERCGEGLEQFIAKCCGAEQAVQGRLLRVSDELRATRSPVLVSTEPARYVSLKDQRGQDPGPAAVPPSEFTGPEDQGDFAEHVGPAEAVQSSQAAEPSRAVQPSQAAAEAVASVPQGSGQQSAAVESEHVARWDEPEEQADRTDDAVPGDRPPQAARNEAPSLPPHYADTPAFQGYQLTAGPGAGPSGGQSPAGTGYARDPGAAPPLPMGDQRQHPAGPWSQPLPQAAPQFPPPAQPRPRRPASMSAFLKNLGEARDVQEFNRNLEFMEGLSLDAQERVRSRRIVLSDEWYRNIVRIHGATPDYLLTLLADIYQAIVVPDLGEKEVASKIAEWAAWAQPPALNALLTAARLGAQSRRFGLGRDSFTRMRQILEPVLAQRYVTQYGFEEAWNPSP
jgi:hypothetical protein